MCNFQWASMWAFLSGIGGLATAVTAYLAFKQLEALNKSIADAKSWNKINSAFSYLPKSHEFNEIEQHLNESFIKLIDRNSRLTTEEMNLLFQNSTQSNETRIKLKNYLNLLEGFCTAIKLGAVDKEAAKSIYSYKFKRHYYELFPYIEYVRTSHNAPELFVNFEEIVKEWEQSNDVPEKY